jgi:hypothetical protein
MGNWYEERLAVPQPQREERDFRTTRETEDAISFISRKDLLMPLGKMSRIHPWNTTGCNTDDGFREYKTMNKTVYDPKLLKNYQGYGDCRPLTKAIQSRKDYPEAHHSIQTSRATKFALLGQENLQRQANEVNREVTQSITNFGSTFKKHHEDHERLFHLTTYQKFYDRPNPITPEEVIERDGKLLSSCAGYEARADHLKGIQMSTALISEVFKQEKDPQQNTRVQRAWLPYVEGAIKAAESNIDKSQTLNSSNGLKTTGVLTNYKTNNLQTLPHDIATSLPMADGAYSLKSKYMEPGSFRRIRSDVTMIRNKPITKK